MNEMDEYAVEEALQAQGGARRRGHHPHAWARTRATETIRKALSMGADKAVHVVDDALHGSDAVATSLALAKAAREGRRRRPGALGSESTDARMSVVPAMLAERLGRRRS